MYDINDSWLSQPPKYTTFRINSLKKFSFCQLEQVLKNQADELNISVLPNYYKLNPDCLILEQWSYNELNLEKTNNDAIVDALCAAAVLRGSHVFAPGVMGLPTNCKLNGKINIYGDLEGNCKRGLKVKYNGKKLYVGYGILKMLRHDLFDKEKSSGMAIQTLMPASKLPVVNETIYEEGVLLLQNLPSIVCGWVVNAKANEFILDMCAAPGNKTTHLAEMSNNQAKIIAIDKTSQKTEKIKQLCIKHEVQCVKIYTADSTKCCSKDSLGVDAGPPFPPNSFDKVLLDAPCSGLGQRPQLNNKITPKMLESYKFVQRKLLSTAVDLLKVGGKLIYSTCTVTVEENEGLVNWALEKYPSLKLIPSHPLMGGPGLPSCGLNDDQRLMVQRFRPEVDILRPTEAIYRDTIGFFIATFTKTANKDK
ncbi:hypothetical protein ACJJTC_013208 [Scirpophaga incertulas]